jgi:hypothetical protein
MMEWKFMKLFINEGLEVKLGNLNGALIAELSSLS